MLDAFSRQRGVGGEELPTVTRQAAERNETEQMLVGSSPRSFSRNFISSSEPPPPPQRYSTKRLRLRVNKGQQ
jgi:hypothetical protein